MFFYFLVDEESELTQLEQEHQMWVWLTLFNLNLKESNVLFTFEYN